MNALIAQVEKPLGGTFKGPGPLGNTADFISDVGVGGMFAKVISLAIGIMTIAAGIWFIFQFIIGAFGWITSGGDKQSAENAKKRITNAVIGLVVVVAGIFLIDLLGGILGFDILNIGKFISGIWS